MKKPYYKRLGLALYHTLVSWQYTLPEAWRSLRNGTVEAALAALELAAALFNLAMSLLLPFTLPMVPLWLWLAERRDERARKEREAFDRHYGVKRDE